MVGNDTGNKWDHKMTLEYGHVTCPGTSYNKWNFLVQHLSKL